MAKKKKKKSNKKHHRKNHSGHSNSSGHKNEQKNKSSHKKVSQGKKEVTPSRPQPAGKNDRKKKEKRREEKKSQDSSNTSTSIQLTKKIRLEGHTLPVTKGEIHHYDPDTLQEMARGPFFKFQRRFIKVCMFFIKMTGVVLGLGAVFLLLLFVVFGRDLPDVSKLKDMNLSETSVLYDREGNVLYSIFSEENRKYVPLNYVSPYVVYATLSIEDKHFFQHMGFDVFGIIRAQLKNIKEDDLSQGASTITQQLAKNVFLSPEKTYERKIKELLLSLQIEWMFSKEQILEMYLNKISYGSNSFGIEAAAKTYFGKTSKDLTLVESSVLAALPKAPSYYSPYGQNRQELMGYCNMQEEPAGEVSTDLPAETPLDVGAEEEIALNETQETVEEGAASLECTGPDDPRYVKGRKDNVLDRMMEDGYINEEQRFEAWKEGLTLSFKDPVHAIEAPHFVFYVKEYLEQKYGKEMVESGGLEVITTLDPKLQSLAEEAIAQQAETNEKRYGVRNSALVALDPKMGQVLAMVGSRNYWDEAIDGQVNVATSLRQPGSSFKPLVYAAAVQNGGIGSGTMLGDYKTVFANDYVPSNSDDTYKGPMTMRKALATSRNIPAIKAWYVAGGEEKVLEFIDGLGVTSLTAFKNGFNAQPDRKWTFSYGPAMAIGSGEVSLLELTAGYGVLANSGLKMPIVPVLEVRDKNGNVLEKYEAKGKQVMDPQAAFVVNNVLSDSSARPAGSWRLILTIPDHTVAAKTGTSNKKVGSVDYPNNLLTLGYTPDLAVGVWSGNTDGSQARSNAWGLLVSGPIWRYFMENALKDAPDVPFPEPEGLIWQGKEVFPSFKKSIDDEKMFERADTQETVEVPISDFILGGDTFDSASETFNGTTPPRVVEPSHPVENPAQGNRGSVDYGF